MKRQALPCGGACLIDWRPVQIPLRGKEDIKIKEALRFQSFFFGAEGGI